MLREVHNSRLIRHGAIFDFELVAVGDRVPYLRSQGSRIPFFAVLADILQDKRSSRLALFFIGFPDLLVKSVLAAVEMVGAVVAEEDIILSIQREFSLGDPVPVRTDQR